LSRGESRDKSTNLSWWNFHCPKLPQIAPNYQSHNFQHSHIRHILLKTNFKGLEESQRLTVAPRGTAPECLQAGPSPKQRLNARDLELGCWDAQGLYLKSRKIAVGDQDICNSKHQKKTKFRLNVFCGQTQTYSQDLY